MGRRVRDNRLETRSARSKLSQRSEPYWRLITEGQHLGYYRGARGGTWVARWRPAQLGSAGYRKTTLGLADDLPDADGLRVLSYDQAQTKAQEWFAQQATLAGEAAPPRRYTVAAACQDYLQWFESHRKSIEQTRRSIAAHIEPAIGKLEVGKLTAPVIRRWHEDLARQGARLRTRAGADQRHCDRDLSNKSEGRRRQATANRVLTILKAALNRAWEEGKAANDSAWRRVKPFRGVDHPRVRYLTDEESVRLSNATAPAFRPMVQAALLTGARYGEICRVQVRDFDSAAGRLTIREPKAGRPRHVVLTQEGISFFTQRALGRATDALLMPRDDGSQWGHAHQQRPLSAACKGAGIAPAASFHILRHTYASRLAMRGVPLNVIAENLGHADTRMTSRHYAHLAPSYMADVIRNAAPALGIVPAAAIDLLHPSRTA